jgi:hypothetical protein
MCRRRCWTAPKRTWAWAAPVFQGKLLSSDLYERQYKPGPEGLWREAGPYGAADEVLVIDAKRTPDGILGSANTLTARVKGTVGFVIDGTCHGSYECILQQTPVFCAVRSPQHPMGRLIAV